MPGMTGTAAPTPASNNPVPQAMLPPGIVLGEGETLVPGKVMMQDVQPDDVGADQDVGKQPPVPDEVEEPEMVEETETAEELKEASAVDPFGNDLGHREENINSFSHLISKAEAEPLPDSDTPSTVDLVPISAEPLEPVQTQDTPSVLNEPSQQEIDSVIEEIFGKAEN